MKRKYAGIFAFSGLILFIWAASVFAASITREFKANESMPLGTIVSIDAEKGTVAKTTPKTIQNVYGVVAKTGDISFSEGANAGKVAVANNGLMPTLVSTAAGDIKNGDPITVKTIEGIGEKATVSGRIVGIAQQDMSSDSPQTHKMTIQYGNETKEVTIGLISIKVAASDYTPATATINQDDAKNRNTLEKIADNLAGKIVKPLGLIIAGLILLSGIFIATFLITSSSYSSMISIGRNPLSEKKIIRSLAGLIILAIGIFCASVLLAYLALKFLG